MKPFGVANEPKWKKNVVGIQSGEGGGVGVEVLNTNGLFARIRGKKLIDGF